MRAFCVFSGLDHYLNKGERPRQDHPDSETLPLAQFYEQIPSQIHAIVRMVRRHYRLSEDNEVYLGTCVSEVAQNIVDHADSRIGGVLCARYMSGSSQLRVAVVDHGVGIPNSLQRVRPGAKDVDLMREVFKGNLTSNPTGRNMGLGLSNLAGIVQNLRGDIVVLSRAISARRGVQSQEMIGEHLDFDFPGTAVFFRLNVSVNV